MTLKADHRNGLPVEAPLAYAAKFCDGLHDLRLACARVACASSRVFGALRRAVAQDSESSHNGRIFAAPRVTRAQRSRASRAGSVTYSRSVRLVNIWAKFTCSG